MKELQRRLEEVQDDVKIVEETNHGLKLDKDRLNTELKDARENYRGVLKNYSADEQDKASMKYRAQQEMNKNYQDTENNSLRTIGNKDKRIEDLIAKQRALKRYARQLKYLAHDLLPVGSQEPEILLQEPPVSLDGEDDDTHMRGQNNEIKRLRDANQQLQ